MIDDLLQCTEHAAVSVLWMPCAQQCHHGMWGVVLDGLWDNMRLWFKFDLVYVSSQVFRHPNPEHLEAPLLSFTFHFSALDASHNSGCLISTSTSSLSFAFLCTQEGDMCPLRCFNTLSTGLLYILRTGIDQGPPQCICDVTKLRVVSGIAEVCACECVHIAMHTPSV